MLQYLLKVNLICK